ncbi:MAG: hotdog fold thioesterase [Flavobacteriales bacterium]|nr:hotdog fold thioesterase [Flavobacteriales bacterium]
MYTQAHAEKANSLLSNTMVEHLDIRFHVDAAGHLCASMPVDSRTHQPAGLLHGGATVALAESLGSMGSFLLVDPSSQAVVGIEVNANHLKGVRTGRVTATGDLVHRGRTTHVWDIRVRNEAAELCAICRLTTVIVNQR